MARSRARKPQHPALPQPLPPPAQVSSQSRSEIAITAAFDPILNPGGHECHWAGLTVDQLSTRVLPDNAPHLQLASQWYVYHDPNIKSGPRQAGGNTAVARTTKAITPYTSVKKVSKSASTTAKVSATRSKSARTQIIDFVIILHDVAKKHLRAPIRLPDGTTSRIDVKGTEVVVTVELKRFMPRNQAYSRTAIEIYLNAARIQAYKQAAHLFAGGKQQTVVAMVVSGPYWQHVTLLRKPAPFSKADREKYLRNGELDVERFVDCPAYYTKWSIPLRFGTSASNRRLATAEVAHRVNGGGVVKEALKVVLSSESTSYH